MSVDTSLQTEPDPSTDDTRIIGPYRRYLPFAIAFLTPFVLASVNLDLGFPWKTIGGVVVIIVVAWMAWHDTKRLPSNHREDMRMWRQPHQRSWAAVLTFTALAVPFVLSADVDPPMNFPWATWFTILNTTLLFALGAAAFNLLVGYTGQISLAHIAFLALGTIVSAQVGIILGWPMPLAVLFAGIAGGLVGVIVGLPALRLRGLYLLLATLGVHFVMLLIYREYLQAKFGFVGISFPNPVLPSWLHWLPFIDPKDGEFVIRGDFRWYWIILPVTVAILLYMSNIVRTREGRAFAAVRERDVSAALLGINVARSKLLAFAVSSAVVSLSGALLSYKIGARGEDSFPLTVVLDYAVIIVVGGFSSIQGAVFGSFFFWGLPQWFEWAREELWLVRDIEFLSDYPNEIDLAVKGVLTVLVLVFKPDGLTGLWDDIKRLSSRTLKRFAT